ncbi:MAG: hypothetical protein PF517_02520 [Salinivirgaceae bacterium]|jgi:hypothetical protein|nr:hypothetical protein [Salinivirgaceae bacterium]
MERITKKNRVSLKMLNFKYGGFILNNIALFNLSGKAVFEKDIFIYLSKNSFSIELPKHMSNDDLLLTVSTSYGQYSKLINHSTKTIQL